jgi:hypothetical protein
MKNAHNNGVLPSKILYLFFDESFVTQLSKRQARLLHKAI